MNLLFSAMQRFLDMPLMDVGGVVELLVRFLINLVVTGCIIQFLYYPKSRRRDYYFTFNLISISVFLMIFLLGSVKIKVGFALGLFAIFGIIRYRTESIAIREMTYLFAIIAISVINALSVDLSLAEILVTNLIFIVAIWVLEGSKCFKPEACKLVLYDKIELVTPQREQELIADLQQRTGLDILRVEVGHIDLLKDAAFVKVYYKPSSQSPNSVDMMRKFPREGE